MELSYNHEGVSGRVKFTDAPAPYGLTNSPFFHKQLHNALQITMLYGYHQPIQLKQIFPWYEVEQPCISLNWCIFSISALATKSNVPNMWLNLTISPEVWAQLMKNNILIAWNCQHWKITSIWVVWKCVWTVKTWSLYKTAVTCPMNLNWQTLVSGKRRRKPSAKILEGIFYLHPC